MITIVTYMPFDFDNFYDLHPSIKQINLNFGGPAEDVWDGIWKNVRRNSLLRKAISDSKPDCVISHLNSANVRTIIATLAQGVPLIIVEHGYPPSSHMERPWNMLRRCLYPLASMLVAPNLKAIECFPDRIRRKGVSIPNPVLLEGLDALNAPKLPGNRNIAAMGRFVPIKQFDLLLEAFAKISYEPDCFLNLVGDGPLREELISLASRLGIIQRVRFWGQIKHPWSLLKNSDMVVVSSESECLPMVVLEAMTCGLPVVSFDCPVGPREIIQDAVDGILVPPSDVDALARAMERLLNDDEERHRLGLEAAKSAEKYSVERIMKQWEDLIERVIECGRHK
jgi:glycosyltransferase involved in cell wall biosynthesis